MKHVTITLSLLVLLAGFATSASAQDRDDIIWARDIGAAEITLDGSLDEAVWDQAEMFTLVWGERLGFPGSGWRVHGTFTAPEPTDPINATIRLLRKGNQLYVGASVEDKSVGGSTGLWNIDGLVTAIANRKNYQENSPGATNFFPGGGIGEYILSWWHEADTTAEGVPTPGTDPRFHGLFGSPNNEQSKEREPDRVAAWDAVTVVDGTSNDDTHGDDNGYVMEMRIDLTELGYDGDQPDGDMVPASFTVYDSDYQWPVDPDRLITTKVWFQSQWGNNLNEGAVRVMMHPGVTVDTDPLPDDPPPDFTIQEGSTFDEPVIDGVLNDAVWDAVPASVQFGYQQTEVNNTLPGFGSYHTFWFRPDLNGMDPDPDVVDPSVIRFKFFHRDDKLYIGADIDDQAVSGKAGEGGDGFSITMERPDSLDGDNTLFQSRFIFDIDSTGAVRLSGEAAVLQAANPDAIQAAAAPKGASTPGDPTDVDEGYQVEIVLDLVAGLGYPAGLADPPWLWMGANLFDTDDFEDPANNTSTRTWWLRERTTGPGAYAYLSPDAIGTAVEEVAEVPKTITLLGNYPNPFNPATRLHYALPQTGDVTVQVFDVLGRRVALLHPGLQSAGVNEVRFEAGSLASGMYVYRVEVKDQATGAVRSQAVGRMVLLK